MTGAESTAVLLLRVVLGVTVIVHGLNHWRGGGRIAGTARWFTGLGLRHGRLQAWLSVVTEVGAGALLVLGLLTPLAGAAVVSVMLVAGLLAHRRNGFFVFKDGYEYVLVLAVACVALAMLGPGDVSLDAAAGIDIDGWAGGGLAAGVGAAGMAGLLAAFWRPGAQLPEATAGEAADGPLGEAPNGPRAKTPHATPAGTADTPPAETPDATRAETPQESPDEGQEPS
ncbi:putative oxidoreductase [Streptomyces sp. SAI-144]|jgi:putative oxidoreductase|uniref:DoxX family protein n=1 Tax=Streptomyces sp. SAI-144 TaxID=2940544 RepID=UPI002473B0BC|nr:DoxX family protein [Streptomyces sp. SAI-144]MDH6436735.1 putative oxidoreductase [Streptomyces sp. SAI-144]